MQLDVSIKEMTPRHFKWKKGEKKEKKVFYCWRVFCGRLEMDCLIVVASCLPPAIPSHSLSLSLSLSLPSSPTISNCQCYGLIVTIDFTSPETIQVASPPPFLSLFLSLTRTRTLFNRSIVQFLICWPFLLTRSASLSLSLFLFLFFLSTPQRNFLDPYW